MLVLNLSTDTTSVDNEVILRDRETGHEIARIQVVEAAHGRLKLGFVAERWVEINRRGVDHAKHRETA